MMCVGGFPTGGFPPGQQGCPCSIIQLGSAKNRAPFLEVDSSFQEVEEVIQSRRKFIDLFLSFLERP